MNSFSKPKWVLCCLFFGCSLALHAADEVDVTRAGLTYDGPYDEAILNGGIHLVVDQCDDGGWAWDDHDVCPATSPTNTVAPIVDGLLVVNEKFGLNMIKNAALEGTAHGLTSVFTNGNEAGEVRLWSQSALHLWRVWALTGDDAYRNFVVDNYYEKFLAGNYRFDQDIDDFIAASRRTTTAYVNLRSWEFAPQVLAAERFCYQGISDKFKEGILTALNDLTNTTTYTYQGDIVYKAYDVLGIAGAVLGLARVNYVNDFPAPINAPNHSDVNGMINLEELTDHLVGLQNPDGSFYDKSGLALTADGSNPLADTQTTAYAVLALVKAQERFPNKNYLPAIESAKIWLASMQDVDGGFLSYPGGDKNSEIEAEAIQALGTEGVYDRIFQGQMECYVN
ncbi:prenyltransferase/squalene oxidase repeat-containing protein [Marinicella gelatinilytica]|uniref:prenyltransferase/squalene oxidase repeat-containing protein n=1 Tax=Marinicella gelatinilytica TaxID=2996017 RepID=UPI002260E36D|nr:prenyltransferase/squalene oxidase repeat-containing protein [Marinicella gelatinilytica]MCX7545572.1 hypothetical protein [Marinicella gelatinilytica]